MNIRNFQPGDEVTQAALYNGSAFAMPGFKPATADEVRRRTRARGFDPSARFYAEAGGQVVGYCVLEPEQGRVSYPWCKKGFDAARQPLFDAAVASATARGLPRLFAAYRKDWEPVTRFFADNGFGHVRDVVNYWMEVPELPTVAARGGLPTGPLQREDLPAVAEIGRGVIRLPEEKLAAYFFNNPYFPVEAVSVLRDRSDGSVAGVGVGLEGYNFADVRKVDPLAPCFRLGAFGTEGVNAKKVNGLFSFLVRKPEQTMTLGLGLLAEAAADMTDGTVSALAAQCPSDVPHLTAFYKRYFREQGRFPVFERDLTPTTM